MKREFLEELGLEKTVIDAIMAEHGKSIEALKDKCIAFDEKEALISSLTEERDSLREALDKESTSHSTFKNGVIDSIISSASPSSKLAECEIRRMLSECESGDLNAELMRIKEENPDAFKAEAVSHPYFSAFQSSSPVMPVFNYRRLR